MPFCENCGSEVSVTSKFCTKCGSQLEPSDISKIDDNQINISYYETPLKKAFNIFDRISDRIFSICVILCLSVVLTVFLNCVTSYFFQDQLTKETHSLAQYAFRAFDTYKLMLFDITGNFNKIEDLVSKLNYAGQRYYDYIEWREGLKLSLIITFFISLPICALIFRYTIKSIKKFFQSLYNISSDSNIN